MDREGVKLDGPGQTEPGLSLLGYSRLPAASGKPGPWTDPCFPVPLGQPFQIDGIGPPDAPPPASGNQGNGTGSCSGGDSGGIIILYSADPVPLPWGVHPMDKLLAEGIRMAASSNSGYSGASHTFQNRLPAK